MRKVAETNSLKLKTVVGRWVSVGVYVTVVH